MAHKTRLLAIAIGISLAMSAFTKAPKSSADIQAAAEKAIATLGRKQHRAWSENEAENIRSAAESILAAKLRQDQPPSAQQLADGKTLQGFVSDMSLVCTNDKAVGSNFRQRICQTRRTKDTAQAENQSQLRELQGNNIELRGGGN
jgi:hypothetical protein